MCVFVTYFFRFLFQFCFYFACVYSLPVCVYAVLSLYSDVFVTFFRLSLHYFVCLFLFGLQDEKDEFLRKCELWSGCPNEFVVAVRFRHTIVCQFVIGFICFSISVWVRVFNLISRCCVWCAQKKTYNNNEREKITDRLGLTLQIHTIHMWILFSHRNRHKTPNKKRNQMKNFAHIYRIHTEPKTRECHKHKQCQIRCTGKQTKHWWCHSIFVTTFIDLVSVGGNTFLFAHSFRKCAFIT